MTDIYVPEPNMQLVRDARELIDGHDGPYSTWINELANALESTTARLREAEAVIDAIDAIEPMWPRGMYGCPQDMIGRNQIRAVTSRYQSTKTEGNRDEF